MNRDYFTTDRCYLKCTLLLHLTIFMLWFYKQKNELVFVRLWQASSEAPAHGPVGRAVRAGEGGEVPAGWRSQQLCGPGLLQPGSGEETQLGGSRTSGLQGGGWRPGPAGHSELFVPRCSQ